MVRPPAAVTPSLACWCYIPQIFPWSSRTCPYRQSTQSLAVLWNPHHGEIPSIFHSAISGTKRKSSILHTVKANVQSKKLRGWQEGPLTQCPRKRPVPMLHLEWFDAPEAWEPQALSLGTTKYWSGFSIFVKTCHTVCICFPMASFELSNLTVSLAILHGLYKNLCCGEKNHDNPKDVYILTCQKGLGR